MHSFWCCVVGSIIIKSSKNAKRPDLCLRPFSSYHLFLCHFCCLARMERVKSWINPSHRGHRSILTTAALLFSTLYDWKPNLTLRRYPYCRLHLRIGPSHNLARKMLLPDSLHDAANCRRGKLWQEHKRALFEHSTNDLLYPRITFWDPGNILSFNAPVHGIQELITSWRSCWSHVSHHICRTASPT